jgi:hypothetical protein
MMNAAVYAMRTFRTAMNGAAQNAWLMAEDDGDALVYKMRHEDNE